MSSLPAATPSRIFGACLAALLMVLMALPVEAQSCFWSEDKSPHRAAHQSLWNGLEPTERPSIPGLRDTSDFNRNGSFSHSRQFWRSIDAEGGYVLTGYNLGIELYNAQAQRQGEPSRVSYMPVEALPILYRNLHDYYLVTDVDWPDGENDVAVMTGWNGMGFVMVDTSNKSRPRVVYQDGGTPGTKYGHGVYATRINGNLYGFMASEREGNPGGQSGLWMYDLTAAANKVGAGFACTEERPSTLNSACTGIFRRKLSTDAQNHVDGAGSDGVGHFLAFSGGAGGDKGLEIHNISSPTSISTQVLNGFADRRIDELAMWQRGSKFYLAVTQRFPDEAAIYDVSCITSGCGGGNPLNAAPLYSFPMPGAGTGTRSTVQHSENNGVPYLYFGRSQSFKMSGIQAEWLLDVSDPANPLEVTGGDPQNDNVGQPTMNFQGDQVGYWSWYYACNESGTNNVEPAGGAVMNGHFYRAGGGIFDVHKLQDVTPRVDISSPVASTYQDTAVSVSATGVNCTPQGNGWTWNTNGGVISGNSSGASISVSWPTTGNKTITASNSSCSGATVTAATINIQSAAPAVASVTSDVNSALVCSPVTFTANGVTGKPAISHGWEIIDAQEAVVATLPGGSTDVTWDTSDSPQPGAGAYRARYTASNSAVPGGVTQLSAPVTISDTGTAAIQGALGTSINFGDVDFTSDAAGATQWIWDFGDGATLNTFDPTVGPSPAHRYDAVGSYTVTLEIRNCKGLAGNGLNEWPTISATVDITETNPLVIHQFEAEENRRFGVSFPYETNQAITFIQEIDGDPDFYDYDWDGDGTYDQTSASVVSNHTYLQAGNFQPTLRVRRGAASRVYQHLDTLDVIAGDPPSISLSGSTSAKVGNNVTFRASATNCNPTGPWTWNATGGGTVNGSGSQVTIRWTTTGRKTVTASHSNCGNASGTRSIIIESNSTPPPPPPPPPSNDLVARISASKVIAEVGESIDFDASNSGGAPSAFTWEFGNNDKASGAQATYSYDEPGLYTVTLTVTKAGDCSFGYCSDEETTQIQVQDTGPQVGGNGCEGAQGDDDSMLCLKSGRFEVDVNWRDHHNDNRTGTGGAKSFAGYDGVTGFFYFFNPNNVDLIVKILETAAGDHWVFYGGLSDVYYQMTVRDTVTGEVREYENLEGSICGQADTAAFPADGGGEVENLSAGADGALFFPGDDVGGVTAAFRPDAGGGGEEEDEGEEPSETLPLLDGRFEVTVDWINQYDNDANGTGTAIPGTENVGYFWFFNERNLEVVAKMVDGRQVNGYWWVFWGGLSDVNYTIRVRDILTDREWTRVNPPGSFCGGGDTTAFSAD